LYSRRPRNLIPLGVVKRTNGFVKCRWGCCVFASHIAPANDDDEMSTESLSIRMGG